MRNRKAILTLLLAALWLVAPSHCGWERLSGFSLFACRTTADAPPASPLSHCGDGFCHAVEGGSYLAAVKKPHDLNRREQQQPAPLPLVEIHRLTDVALRDRDPRDATDPPPELVKTWQFHSRTAPSPRAPSLSS